MVVLVLFFFFCVGLYTFFLGLKIFRKIEILKDTPIIPIRSLPMGLVRIHGKASGDQLVNGPVSQTPCHFYWVDIEIMADNNWRHYSTDAEGPLFYLDDDTGKVPVDAHNAEYDLVQSVWRELGKRFSSTGSTPATSLLAYIGGVHAPHPGELPLALGSGGLPLGYFRLTEYLILPGHCYDIVGTCTENPSPKGEYDRNLIKKGQNEPTFIITTKTEKQEESTLRRRALGQMFLGAAVSIVMLVTFLAKLGWLF